MTPFLFGLIVKANQDKIETDGRQRRFDVWHIAVLSRVKKIPSFDQFVNQLKKSQKTGIDETDIKTRLKAYQDGKSSKS